jgi:hypothetical protein
MNHDPRAETAAELGVCHCGQGQLWQGISHSDSESELPNARGWTPMESFQPTKIRLGAFHPFKGDSPANEAGPDRPAAVADHLCGSRRNSQWRVSLASRIQWKVLAVSCGSAGGGISMKQPSRS